MKSFAETIRPIQKINIARHIIAADGTFPNNGLLPLLFYRQALNIEDDKVADTIKEILESNHWTNSWVDGIFDYHHYHSTAHEVLVIIQGSSRVQFGGPNGIILTIEKGDVVIIPAGVAHKQIDDTEGFTCMGAYPEGRYDMHFGKVGERPGTDENIKKVALPENDPLYGNDGPLNKNWFSKKDQNSPVS